MNRTPGIANTKQTVLRDDLEGYVDETAEADPRFRAALDDAEDLQRLMDCLTSLRLNREISQSEVARRMGVRQPTVSEFEKATSDPKLSTLQRYARAIDARIRLIVSVSNHSGWSSPSTVAYARGRSTPTMTMVNVPKARHLVSAAETVHWAHPAVNLIA